MRKRLENSTYSLTVEGECEKLYFEHLKKLINTNENRKRNCVFKPEISKRKPLSFAKANAHITTPFFHIQDIEDYNDERLKLKFNNLLKELKAAKKIVNYDLGYSNYSFELWICLHKLDMFSFKHNRNDYYIDINKGFNTNYKSCNEFKEKNEFLKLLSNITLEDVSSAITRSIKIKERKENKKKISLYNFEFYKDNPDLSIHEIVKTILNDCL